MLYHVFIAVYKTALSVKAVLRVILLISGLYFSMAVKSL